MNTVILINDKREFFALLNEWEATKPKDKKTIVETNDDYLTQREAARFLKISIPTLIKWKKEMRIPFYQQGKIVLYKKSELMDAIRIVSSAQMIRR